MPDSTSNLKLAPPAQWNHSPDMPLLNPRQKSRQGTFTQIGDEPLSKQVIGVRLPESIYEAVHNLPNRAEWLRRVISEAAQRELMAEPDDSAKSLDSSL
jgi:hypothetical protein